MTTENSAERDARAAGTPSGRGFSFTPSVATVSFHKFRGPGKVTFDKARIPVTKQGEKITGAATFDAPGDYLLRDNRGRYAFELAIEWAHDYAVARLLAKKQAQQAATRGVPAFVPRKSLESRTFISDERGTT